MAMTAKGSFMNKTGEFSESHLTLLKHNRHRKCASVEKSEDYKAEC
jgi:hypothetical protein